MFFREYAREREHESARRSRTRKRDRRAPDKQPAVDGRRERCSTLKGEEPHAKTAHRVVEKTSFGNERCRFAVKREADLVERSVLPSRTYRKAANRGDFFVGRETHEERFACEASRIGRP
jgi:hypothetical protein